MVKDSGLVKGHNSIIDDNLVMCFGVHTVQNEDRKGA